MDKYFGGDEETYDRTRLLKRIYSHINEEIATAIRRDSRLLLTHDNSRGYDKKNEELHKVDFKTTELAHHFYFI
jgi:hypothetical protein